MVGKGGGRGRGGLDVGDGAGDGGLAEVERNGRMRPRPDVRMCGVFGRNECWGGAGLGVADDSDGSSLGYDLGI